MMLSLQDVLIISGGLLLFTLVSYLRIRVRSSLRIMIVTNLMVIIPLYILYSQLDEFITLVSILGVAILGILYIGFQYNNQIGLPYRRMFAAMVRAEDNKNLDVQSTLDTKITGEMLRLQDKQINFIYSMSTLINSVKQQNENISKYLADLTKTGDQMEEEIGTVTNDIDKILQTAAVISESVDEIRNQGLNLVDKTDSNFNLLEEISNSSNRITDQTNIIAVNAAIEAAHTEVEGSNFTTVADGIQAISKRSRETTDKLSSSIIELRRGLVQDIGKINNKLDMLEDRIFELGELANRSSSFAHQQKTFLGEIRGLTERAANSAEGLQSLTKSYNTD